MSEARETVDDLIHAWAGDDRLEVFWEAINRLIEEEKSALQAQLEEARSNSYPHMCRMDHVQIGHSVSDEDERCPMCRLIDKLAARDAELQETRAEELKLLREIAGPDWDGCVDPDFLEQFDPYAAIRGMRTEAAELRASLQAAEAEVRAIKNSHAIVSDALEQAVKRENAAIQRAEKAEHHERVAQRALSSADCRYAGRVAEMGGSHCPLGEPCDRCAAERRERKLESALAAARKALEDLRGAAEFVLKVFEPAIGTYIFSKRLALTKLRAALERINGEGPVRNDLAFQIESGIDLGDWSESDIEQVFREHLELQASITELLRAIPTIRNTADPNRLRVVRDARRLVAGTSRLHEPPKED